MKKLPIVDEVMDHVYLKFTPDTPLHEAVNTLGRKRLFGACVADSKDKILGILSEKKCLNLYKDALISGGAEAISKLTVADIMHSEFQTVPRTMGIADVARVFLNNEFRRMPVVEGEKLVGQITRRDIIRAIQKLNL